jgi:hypothetical protein
MATATKTAKKPAAKAAVAKKPVKAAAPAARKAAAPAPAKARPAGTSSRIPVAAPEKPKKPKLVRDSFTIPKVEYAVLDELKLRAAKLGRPAKKSEVLRAGLKVLAGLGDPAFLEAVAAVPAVKTGRPAKD